MDDGGRLRIEDEIRRTAAALLCYCGPIAAHLAGDFDEGQAATLFSHVRDHPRVLTMLEAGRPAARRPSPSVRRASATRHRGRVNPTA